MDDLTTLLPPSEKDAVILEEPEHLNWYHHGERWTDAFEHVVGVAHTNYLQYARFDNNGMVKSGYLKEGFTYATKLPSMHVPICAAWLTPVSIDVCRAAT